MIEYDDVLQAANRIENIAVRTPLITNAELDRLTGGRVLLKLECLQRTGSFKIRGAFNLMSQLSKSQSANGVVAWSSGNHAQGVACAGRLLGIRTTIVMPRDAPVLKLENTRRLGAEVVLYDRASGDREAIARQIAVQRGAELVPSYDHPHIITGQGTVGFEIAEQCKARGLVPDQVLVCCGGGGLIAGSAIALTAVFRNVNVHPVEPAQFDDTARSLAAGRRERNRDSAMSICDALQTVTPGEITFAINKRLLSHGLVTSDDDVGRAMRFGFEHLKLVIEPGGAVALAAALAHKIETAGRTTVVVISGGNVDGALFASIQSQTDPN